MKVLFTILAIETNNDFYLQTVLRLTKEIILNTPHSVLISTNNESFFKSIKSDRVFVRDNIEKTSILKYRNIEFNYNLKYHCFLDLPENYEVIFYLDGDIKSNFWNEESDNLLNTLVSNFDFVATRLECVLKHEVGYLKDLGKCLFEHKIIPYKILEWNENDLLMDASLPSEHFLIFKYNKEKIQNFANKWRDFNYQLQELDGGYGSWGDGFEIGISAKYAKYDSTYNLSFGDLETKFGFKFNGNKN
jgi:hypothetical protein